MGDAQNLITCIWRFSLIHVEHLVRKLSCNCFYDKLLFIYGQIPNINLFQQVCRYHILPIQMDPDCLLIILKYISQVKENILMCYFYT